MAKGTIKDVSINISDRKQLKFFIELVADSLKNVEFFLNYKLGTVKIRIVGEKYEVNEAVYTVKTLSKMFLDSFRPDSRGYYTHHLKLLQKSSSSVISLDTLSTVLNYLDYSSAVNDHELRTTATLQETQDVIEYSYEILQSFTDTIKGKALRKVILTSSYITGYPPDFVLDLGIEKGYLKTYKEKIVVTQDPLSCIDHLIDELSKETIKEKYSKYTEKTEEDISFGGTIEIIDNREEKIQ